LIHSGRNRIVRGGATLLAALIAMVTTGCGELSYLSHLGWNQAQIINDSVPVSEVLQKGSVDGGVKERIRFIQEVKSFGEQNLGLEKTDSYSKFFECDGPVLYMVTACPKDRLHPLSWRFPIVGEVTYKGFFGKEKAIREKRALDEKGFDTYVQGTGAYSTLGWLKDPIFSTMLGWDDPALANLILHEMTHATIYFKGQTSLNEQVATFVGNRGAIEFFSNKYGAGADEVQEAIHAQEDDLLFSRWITQACERVARFYDQDLSKEEKLRGRENLFRSLKGEFRDLKTRFKTDTYPHLDRVELNNAVLLAYRRYFHQLDRFETLHEDMGQDLRRTVGYFKEIQSSGNMAAVASLMR
jgi:predicted aminopeptidase